jgi:3-phytase
LLHLEPFGTISIEPSEIEFDAKGDGSNVDSISFWEAPDPAGSLMFVTSKGNPSIEVYQYPFHTQLKTIECGGASNGVWVDQERDLLYITERDSSNVCAFNVPGLEANVSLRFTTLATGDDSEPNLTMLHLPDGQSRIYVSYDDEVFFHNAETGEALGSFTPSEGLETMYGDDYYQVIYIPDEGDRSGVYAYDQDGNPAGSSFGDRSIFESDAEGIWVYKCRTNGGSDNGEGLIVVADQKDDLTDFEVFDRKTKAHLGTINISGVSNTDGIAITQQASPAYPLGLLAVIDDDTSTVGVGWDTILAKTDLSCGN